MKIPGTILLFLAALALATQSGKGFAESNEEPDNPPSWHRFGKPGAGKIRVVAAGNFRYSGTYHVPKGIGLKYFYGMCGGSANKGNFGGSPPYEFRVKRIVDGKEKLLSIKASEFRQAKAQDFELLDYDLVYASIRIF